jgi:cell division protease FtsH
LLGILKKEDDRTPENLRRIAIHELGHAIMVAVSEKFFVLDKISIQNSYSGMEGYTMYRERSPEDLSTKELLRRKIGILFGGYIAEKLFYGEDKVSIGSSQDIKQANELAKRMLNIFGFGKSLLSGGAGEEYFSQRDISDITRAKKETEIAQLLKECFAETEETLKKYMGSFEHYINELIQHKTISGEPFSTNIYLLGNTAKN